MHVVVIGGGVVGVTTAQALVARGHRVTVIERCADVGLETSRANAGQRSYGYVSPWASPTMVRKALPWLLQADGPFKLHLPPSLRTLRFLFATWRFAQGSDRYERNKRAMLRLGAYSRQCFQALEVRHDLAFDGAQGGLIDLASDTAAADGLKATAGLLSELDIDHQWLTPAQLREHEPGLCGEAPLVGALRLPDDGTGDCHRFTRALADCCRDAGVTFRCRTEVTDLVRRDGLIQALVLAPVGDGEKGGAGGATEILEADAVVMCAGCLSRPLAATLGIEVPIYPVKGYSLTVDVADPSRAPRSTVIDDRYKVVATRLGERLRVTGFVELADFDRRIPAARLATLRRAVESRFPGAADLAQAEPWTGFRPMTPDGPPVIGQLRRDNLYFNTGHGTFGWTLSAGSAELIAQVIDDESPALALDAFAPGRFMH
ncbi:D-amino acid dehydrogenase [Modicisalibacter sp. 'Wilcox']|uniref:D-amino acid dehydrogenase n=1 Tax=Modicisalibacter sp. 'Wilcox' TaxID=2679914 RepID=UPI0013CF6F4F|nr:D-amino acid dehydrogenase [Modicisalibacter sp. 'Wilcox']